MLSARPIIGRLSQRRVVRFQKGGKGGRKEAIYIKGSFRRCQLRGRQAASQDEETHYGTKIDLISGAIVYSIAATAQKGREPLPSPLPSAFLLSHCCCRIESLPGLPTFSRHTKATLFDSSLKINIRQPSQGYHVNS